MAFTINFCVKCNLEQSQKKWYRSIKGNKSSGYLCGKCYIKDYTIRNKSQLTLKKKLYIIKNKDVINKKHRKYYKENRERLKEGVLQRQKRNYDQYLLYQKSYRENHKQERKLYVERNKKAFQQYEISRRSRRNTRHKLRRLTDVQFRLSGSLRSRLSNFLNKSGSSIKDLGCSLMNLKQYLESKFQPGMTWDNYGRTGWHIDHIIPLCKFDLTNKRQFLRAVHYTNLQPLWAKDNLSKGGKYYV